jgi:hypothetical protein
VKTTQQPWEKYGISETAFLVVYSSGYNSTFSYNKVSNPHPAGSVYAKIWAKARRDGKRGY